MDRPSLKGYPILRTITLSEEVSGMLLDEMAVDFVLGGKRGSAQHTSVLSNWENRKLGLSQKKSKFHAKS